MAEVEHKAKGSRWYTFTCRVCGKPSETVVRTGSWCAPCAIAERERLTHGSVSSNRSCCRGVRLEILVSSA